MLIDIDDNNKVASAIKHIKHVVAKHTFEELKENTFCSFNDVFNQRTCTFDFNYGPLSGTVNFIDGKPVLSSEFDLYEKDGSYILTFSLKDQKEQFKCESNCVMKQT